MCYIMIDTGRSISMSHLPGDNGLILIPLSPKWKRFSGGSMQRCDVSTWHHLCWISVLVGFAIMSNFKDESMTLHIFQINQGRATCF